MAYAMASSFGTPTELQPASCNPGLHNALSDHVSTPQRIEKCDLGENHGGVRCLKEVTNATRTLARNTGSE